MKYLVSLSVLFLFLLSCSNLLKEESVDNISDSSLIDSVENLFFRTDTLIKEQAIIIEMNFDTNFIKHLEDTLNYNIPLTSNKKFAVLKRVSRVELDSTVFLPINLPAEYYDSTMWNNYIYFEAYPLKFNFSQYPFLKVVKLKIIKQYSLLN